MRESWFHCYILDEEIKTNVKHGAVVVWSVKSCAERAGHWEITKSYSHVTRQSFYDVFISILSYAQIGINESLKCSSSILAI